MEASPLKLTPSSDVMNEKIELYIRNDKIKTLYMTEQEMRETRLPKARDIINLKGLDYAFKDANSDRIPAFEEQHFTAADVIDEERFTSYDPAGQEYPDSSFKLVLHQNPFMIPSAFGSRAEYRKLFKKLVDSEGTLDKLRE
jgi:hypothetical protein